MKKLCVILCLSAVSLARAVETFTLTPPPDFKSPQVTTKGPAEISTYTSSTGGACRLEISVVTVPPEGKGDSLNKILSGMIRTTQRQVTDFKRSETVKGKLG